MIKIKVDFLMILIIKMKIEKVILIIDFVINL